MDYNQTCADIYFGGAKTNKILVTLTPFFKVTGKNDEKCLVSTLSPEWIDITTPAEINH